ncbi:6637_t:CDS:1, partial [Funneliformis mosseae]
GWQTAIEQNDKHFYMHITEVNEVSELLPGYRCLSGSKFSDIETASNYAITSLY